MKLFIRLYRKTKTYCPRLFDTRGVERNLRTLFPNEVPEQARENYYVRKLMLVAAVLMGGIVLGIGLIWQEKEGKSLEGRGILYRSSIEDKEIELTARYRGEEYHFPLTISVQKLSMEEVEELATQLEAQLPTLIQGENTSLQEVTAPLFLAEEYEGFPFYIIWESSHPHVIDPYGECNEVEETTEVTLTAQLFYEDYQKEISQSVAVQPPVYEEYTRQKKELQKLLTEGEAQTRENPQWELPEEIEGEPIYWKQKSKPTGVFVVIGSFALAAVLYFAYDKDLSDKNKKRQEQLKQEYPVLLHKMVLYMGAGMPIRSALGRIVKDDEKKDKNQTPTYEEISRAVHELQTGVPEGKVYEALGQRTGLQAYVKLGTLLSQNLKYGNRHLLERLREEADRVMEERVLHTRKLSEEAGTKLIVPMVLQLAVVLIMIVVPAFGQI